MRNGAEFLADGFLVRYFDFRFFAVPWCRRGWGETDHPANRIKNNCSIFILLSYVQSATNQSLRSEKILINVNCFVWCVATIWKYFYVWDSADRRILEGVHLAVGINFFHRIELLEIFWSNFGAHTKLSDPESNGSSLWKHAITINMNTDGSLAARNLSKLDVDEIIIASLSEYRSIQSGGNELFVRWRVLLSWRVPSFWGNGLGFRICGGSIVSGSIIALLGRHAVVALGRRAVVIW